jgi:outer membrane protein TolC
MSSAKILKKLATIVLVVLVFGNGPPFWLTTNCQTVTALPQTVDHLTLAQAVEIALERNPSMAISGAGRKLAAAQLQEARAGRLPLLQVTETFTRSNNPVFVFGSLLEQGRFGPSNFEIDSLNHPNALNNFRSAVTLQVPVFDQRQTGTRVAQARIAQRKADEQAETTAQELRFAVIRAYYRVLVAEAQVEVSRDAVKTAEADVQRARDLFVSGLVVRSDLLAAEVQLSEFRQQLIQAGGELVTSRAALNTALGLPVDTPQQLAGKLVAREFAVEDVAALSNQALQSRPDYRRAILSSEMSAAQLRGARGAWLPRADAFVTAGASSRYLVGGSGDYAVGASVSFNLFDAGRSARIDQARAAQSLAEAEQEQLANQIRYEVVRAYQNYVTARDRMEVVSRVTAQAAETLRITQDRYHAGLTTMTELLLAETALVRARASVLAARYDQYVGYASVLLATGRLNDVAMFG